MSGSNAIKIWVPRPQFDSPTQNSFISLLALNTPSDNNIFQLAIYQRYSRFFQISAPERLATDIPARRLAGVHFRVRDETWPESCNCIDARRTCRGEKKIDSARSLEDRRFA